MLKQKNSFKKNLLSIWLLFVVFGLLIVRVVIADVTYYTSDYNILNGTYLAGSVPSLQTVDSDYFVVTSSPSATSASSYNPSTYSLFGGTAYVSGTTVDLVSDNSVHMSYRGYPSVASTQTLYAHQEVTTIGGYPYYPQKPESADLAGTSLSASMAPTGRQLFGRFVYPLMGISSIPASTWTGFYRAWRDSDPSIAYDSVGSGNNGDGGANITWTHVVGSGNNRFIMIGISLKIDTISVSSMTVGSQAATFLRSDVNPGEARGEIWYLINPDPGSKTVMVTLSGTSKACGGSVSYTGVDQSSPIDNHQGILYGGITPSISMTTTVTNDWIFSNLAISGSSTLAVHGAGQAHRFYEVGTGGSGSSRAGIDGDDKPTTISGPYGTSWNMSFYSEVVAQAAAFKPAPSPAGHVDVDIFTLKSDGTVRSTLATNVASSGSLTPTIATLSGTYSWTEYTVVDQTDCLEMDYYVEVTAATSGALAYLRIDDSTLPLDDQTKMANIMLPSEYTIEVELMGTSNAYSWTQLNWTVDSAWTTDTVTTTFQLYNYALGAYPISGDGFISYATNATANTDETKTQSIATNLQNFRDAAGYWKIKIRGIKTTNTPFDLKADLVEIRPTYYSEHMVSAEFQFSFMTNATPIQLNFTLVNEYDIEAVAVTIQVWNYSSSAFVDNGQGVLKYVSSGTNETRWLGINENPQFYVMNGNARIRIAGVKPTPSQFVQKTNQVKLDYDSADITRLPFDWLTVFLFTLPLPFGFLFFWFLWNRRRRQAKPLKKETGSFSTLFGMTHQQIVGKKILLEIDPTSDFDMALSSFVSEARTNDEPLFVLTNKNSALHLVFSEAGDVNFLLLSSKARYSQQISERETLLPSNDLSVILNACAKTQQGEDEKALNLLFDNLSDIVHRSGLEKTYNFTRLLLEAISSSKTTALFVFVPTAHDQETSSSIRALFHNKLIYAKTGPEVGSL